MIAEITLDQHENLYMNRNRNVLTKQNNSDTNRSMGNKVKNKGEQKRTTISNTKIPIIEILHTDERNSNLKEDYFLEDVHYFKTDSPKSTKKSTTNMINLNSKNDGMRLNEKENMRYAPDNVNFYQRYVNATHVKSGKLSSYILKKKNIFSYENTKEYSTLNTSESQNESFFNKKLTREKFNINQNSGEFSKNLKGRLTHRIEVNPTIDLNKFEIQNPFKKLSPQNISMKGGRVELGKQGRSTHIGYIRKNIMNPIQVHNIFLANLALKKKEIIFIQRWWKIICELRYKKIKKTITIQSYWRGHNLRYKLYIILLRYYKGRAFIQHINKIRRNIRISTFKMLFSEILTQKYKENLHHILYLQRIIKRFLINKETRKFAIAKALNIIFRNKKLMIFKLFEQNTVGNTIEFKRNATNAVNFVKNVEKKMKHKYFRLILRKVYESSGAAPGLIIKDKFLSILLRKFIRKITLDRLDKYLSLWKLKSLYAKNKEENARKLENLLKTKQNKISFMTYKLIKSKIMDEEKNKKECYRRWRIFHLDACLKMYKDELLQKKLETIDLNSKQVEINYDVKNNQNTPNSISVDKEMRRKDNEVQSLLITNFKFDINSLYITNPSDNNLDKDNFDKLIKEEVSIERTRIYEKLKSIMNILEQKKLKADYPALYYIFYNIDKDNIIQNEIEHMEKQHLETALKSKEERQVLENNFSFTVFATPQLRVEEKKESPKVESPNFKEIEPNLEDKIRSAIRKSTAMTIILVKQNLKNKNIYLRTYWKRWKEEGEKISKLKPNLLLNNKSEEPDINKEPINPIPTPREKKKVKPKLVKADNKIDFEDENKDGDEVTKKVVSKKMKPKIVKTDQYISFEQDAGAKAMVRVSRSVAEKLLHSCFHKWSKNSYSIAMNKIMAEKNLQKVIVSIFKLKAKDTGYYFKQWFNIAKHINSKLTNEKIKASLYLKIVEKFLSRGVVGVFHQKFIRWKNMSSNLKHSLMTTIATSKLGRSVKKITFKWMVREFFNQLQMIKLEQLRKDKLKTLYNSIRKNEKLIERMKFSRWRGPEAQMKKFNLIEQLNRFFRCTYDLQRTINRIALKKCFPKILQFGKWKSPEKKVFKVRYTKYFLKDGKTVSVRRERVSNNYMWKFGKPLRYYFYKFKQFSTIMKEKEYEKLSTKWQIEDRKVDDMESFK